MRQSMNVLVVEDNALQAAYIVRVLKEYGWGGQVKIVCDGMEALRMLFGDDEPYPEDSQYRAGLVLLDLDIPSMNGLDVLKQIKNDPRTRAIPVIVLTASYLENDMSESYRLGANSFLHKPVNLDQLTQVLQYWAGDGLEAHSGG